MTFETKFVCEVCGKTKGKYVDHKKCSVINKNKKQTLHKKTPQIYTDKKINQFLKFLGK